MDDEERDILHRLYEKEIGRHEAKINDAAQNLGLRMTDKSFPLLSELYRIKIILGEDIFEMMLISCMRSFICELVDSNDKRFLIIEKIKASTAEFEKTINTFKG